MTGFALVHLTDPVAIKRIPLAKPALWAAGIGLITYSGLMASLSGEKFNLPTWAIVLGWFLLALSSVLVVLSLFVNLPFRKTYVSTGTSDRLVTTGLYSLTRHPGVLWTTLLVASLALVSRSDLVLAAAPIVIVVDVVLVAMQDRFFFGRMFSGYDRYRKDTPMLIPNGRSIRNFALWFRRTCSARSAKGESSDFQLG